MPNYDIEVDVFGSLNVTLEADTLEEAESLALQLCQSGDLKSYNLSYEVWKVEKV